MIIVIVKQENTSNISKISFSSLKYKKQKKEVIPQLIDETVTQRDAFLMCEAREDIALRR